jgi:hypothetical protein
MRQQRTRPEPARRTTAELTDGEANLYPPESLPKLPPQSLPNSRTAYQTPAPDPAWPAREPTATGLEVSPPRIHRPGSTNHVPTTCTRSKNYLILLGSIIEPQST